MTCNVSAEMCFSNSTPETGTNNDTLEQNKKLVISFYNMALNDHRPQEAADAFIGGIYIQHNPSITNGKQAFIDFVIARVKQYPYLHADIKSVFAEGDKVLLHVHSKVDPQDRGRAIVDIFRIESGKIVEHWDVIQAIPEKSANDNGMF
jgi:predicted SnoaL-like aldol condensation-catalyzing enzyme